MNSDYLSVALLYKFLDTRNDDMFCDECKEPFVNPDSYCKHQCDDEFFTCDHGGECVVDDEGVIF